MRLDHVDIFYSHRLDPDTPLEETMGALDTAVRARQGALRRDLLLRARAGRGGGEILCEMGTPLLIHQPSYSMLNRWIEPDLLDVLEREGVGCIAFSPLAQGLLTNKYLNGIPEDSRVRRGLYFSEDMLTEENVARARALNAIAARPRPDARADGASPGRCATRASPPRWSAPRASPSWRELAALDALDFDDAELAEIDRHAVEGGVNIWAQSSDR